MGEMGGFDLKEFLGELIPGIGHHHGRPPKPEPSVIAPASAAARSIGANVTVYTFDNNATLWVVEDGSVKVG
jgi:hypothetical protein